MPAHFSFYQALRLLEGQRWVHVMRRKIEILAEALALTAASLISTSTQTVGSSDKTRALVPNNQRMSGWRG